MNDDSYPRPLRWWLSGGFDSKSDGADGTRKPFVKTAPQYFRCITWIQPKNGLCPVIRIPEASRGV
jgi:hypothetical protein